MDDQEHSETDTVISEFDISLKRLGLVILEQFFRRNFELTHNLFNIFLVQMTENKFTNATDPHIYDNILSATGLLPSIYKKMRANNPELLSK